TAKKIPGMVWGIVTDGRLVHVGSSGVQDLSSHSPVTVATVFRIASMTKRFTVLAVLKLRDEGKLSLEDPVSKWLPEFAQMELPTRDTAPLRGAISSSPPPMPISANGCAEAFPFPRRLERDTNTRTTPSAYSAASSRRLPDYLMRSTFAAKSSPSFTWTPPSSNFRKFRPAIARWAIDFSPTGLISRSRRCRRAPSDPQAVF